MFDLLNCMVSPPMRSIIKGQNLEIYIRPIFTAKRVTREEDLKIGQIEVGPSAAIRWMEGAARRRGDLDFNDMVAKSSASATCATMRKMSKRGYASLNEQ